MTKPVVFKGGGWWWFSTPDRDQIHGPWINWRVALYEALLYRALHRKGGPK